MYQGFVTLGDTLNAAVTTKNASAVPINADAAPTFRCYGASGLLASSIGTATQKHTGSVTGATNASPIVVSSTSHGLSTGQRVTISGVGGNNAANGSFNVTRVNANSFSLDGSTGDGDYTSGGTWNVAGLYNCAVVASEGNGFDAGETYVLLVSWLISSGARQEAFTFTVT